MTALFKKFPHIEQFKSCIKQVRDTAKWNSIPLPKLTFTGTVKLHGTNAAIGLHVPSGEQFYQSRERLINIQSDNCGFAMWASGSDEVSRLVDTFKAYYNPVEYLHIFGEWAGKGVQKGVGISEFEKSFYIFAVSVDDQWVELPEQQIFIGERIFFVKDFQTYTIDIDFSAPELSQNQLVELTIQVENECPVSKQLGKYGMIGEGIVWSCQWESNFLMYKTKGEKHSASKVKSVKQIAAIDVEKIATIREFVSDTLAENRLEQGISKLVEMGLDPIDNKNIGFYIKWCVDDVFREEHDTIVESQLDTKLLGKELSTVARNYFLNRSI